MRAPDPGAGGVILEGVTAGYGRSPVLREVSLVAPPGRITGLIGPNGSGKTTIVRVASRALRPRSGSVRVAGVDPYAIKARAAARKVAVVPQDVLPAFPFTVLELVLMGRSPYRSPWGGGSAEDWVHVRRAMGAAGVQHLAERQLGELSGGERQRAVLAQALAQDAPALLLDEPTTHLDVRHVIEFLGLLQGLARKDGRTVLAVFHDLNLAASYCERVYALNEGRVVAGGPPESVITRDLVLDVFGVEAEVSTGPGVGRPFVSLAPSLLAAPTPRGAPRAHVMGGAGRGAGALRALSELGFEVSTGVLHLGDTDAGVAERLNLLRVTVPPFSSIDARSASDCAQLVAAASVLVVCDAPFGEGNLENLAIALEAARAGRRVLLFEEVPIEERDFTGGRASAMWRELRVSAKTVSSLEELLRTLKESRVAP